MKHTFAVLAAVLVSSFPASAQFVIDGAKDANYGSALSVQTVQTQFTDNLNEWNAAYGSIESGRLFLMLTGNLQANLNKLSIFIDSTAGGQSVFDSSGNDNANAMDGLIFDNGFTADYHLIARRGNGNTFDLDFADLGAQSASGYGNIFNGSDFGSGTTGTGVNASTISIGYNGSNTGGVTGGTGAADQMAALAVTTGLELSISLADLNYDNGPIRVMIGQNNNDHNFWSNQFLGGLAPGQGNLGGDGNGTFTGEGAVDMRDFAGDQFFTVTPVPEPSSLALMTLGALGVITCVCRRK